MDEFLAATEAAIARWFGIAAPTDPARRMAAEMEQAIRAFEAQRGTLRFEDEPSSFELVLFDTRDTAP